jgi:hypothetical protein
VLLGLPVAIGIHQADDASLARPLAKRTKQIHPDEQFTRRRNAKTGRTRRDIRSRESESLEFGRDLGLKDWRKNYGERESKPCRSMAS